VEEGILNSGRSQLHEGVMAEGDSISSSIPYNSYDLMKCLSFPSNVTSDPLEHGSLLSANDKRVAERREREV